MITSVDLGACEIESSNIVTQTQKEQTSKSTESEDLFSYAASKIPGSSNFKATCTPKTTKVPSISDQGVYKVMKTETHFSLIISPVNPDSGAVNPILAADSVEQATSIISDKLVICGKKKTEALSRTQLPNKIRKRGRPKGAELTVIGLS